MGSIHKLPADVVNRIAAGEVVQRPSAALKELLENAIDAGCSRVQVVAGDGGLEVLQVSDDGCGVHKEDLPLLCERYATSKLNTFEDLQRVSSFGFRGEALASISYVSRVSVTTRRRHPTAAATGAAEVAWRCQYLNGALVGDPQPCAGNPGTTIRAEKLFYNTLVRRHSLRASEEWGRIVDVVSRYALAFPTIGFTCQREGGGGGGGGGGGVTFPPLSSTRQNIRLSHGSQLAGHLRLVYAYQLDPTASSPCDAAPEPSATVDAPQLSSSKHTAADEARVFAQMEQRARRVRATSGAVGEGLFTLVGYTSDPTLAHRKPYLCLFINQRLVDNAAVRKAIDAVYSGVLTGGHRPFTVLLLSVPADRVDVNVHPTKKEVGLLDEELIVARVAEVCRGAVLEAAAARQMDMLKMRHTAALALKEPLPSADGLGAADGAATAEWSGNSSQHILEKLRDRHQRGIPLASPLTSAAPSSTAAGAAAAPQSRGPAAVVVAPCTVVRVEPQRGALDRYMSQRRAATATATAPSVVEVSEPTVPRASEQHCLNLSGDVLHEVGERTPIDDSSRCGQGNSAAAAHQTAGDPSSPSTAVYDAPSWTAVMASLHSQRPTTTTTAAAAAAAAALGDSDGALRAAPTASRPEVCQSSYQVGTATGVDAGGGTAHGAVVDVDDAAMAPVRQEGVASSSAVSVAAHRAYDSCGGLAAADDDGDDDDDDDDDDDMREFKRHRHEVHERAQLLQHVVDAASAPRSGAVVGEAHPATADLGAVVQAADMLRREAAAAVVGFSHTVVSGDDSDADEQTASAPPLDAGTNTTTTTTAAAGEQAASLVGVAEVPATALLSSVSLIVERLVTDASPTADCLVDQLAYVGAVDAAAFLAQAGTTLLWCDTMALVRHAVFQRIFLRWGQPALPPPPVMLFSTPLRVSDLLLHALAYDGPHLQPPSPPLLDAAAVSAAAVAGGLTVRAWRQLLFVEDTAEAASTHADSPTDAVDALSSAGLQPREATLRYVRRLVRRLCRWRGLLKEYFYIDITSDGVLVGLPYGLNRHWPPRMRAVPLTVWLLAEAVPYPSTTEPAAAAVGAVVSSTVGGGAAQARALPTPPLQGGEGGRPGLNGSSVAAVECVARSQTEATPTPTPQSTAMEAEADGVAQEVACFTAVARHLAEALYGFPPPPPQALADTAADDVTSAERWREELVQHGLFPCLKNAQLFRLPDRCLRDGTIRSMVSVESLYKVFERC
ncbi:mismatch repair protein [Novymonas esmeraldas]|uniref:Mismatch repair protein n=1 Tax=Novymonas esmeraldas TaxID=1808958 RepID=A0AAW0ER28_9TRYP